MLQQEPELSSIVFDDGEAMARQGTGHGCGSLTMAMSAGRLSLFAAGMAEYLLGRQENGLPDEGGEVVVGRISDDGLGVAWRAEQIPPVTVVEAKNGSPWRVHLYQRALSKMQAEAGHWPDSETGGVLSWVVCQRSRELPMSWTCWTHRRTASARPASSSSAPKVCDDVWRTTRRPSAGRSIASEHGTVTCLQVAHLRRIVRRRERCRWRGWRRRYF